MNEAATVNGTVTQANERGFQLHGTAEWYNWSKYAKEPRTLPAPGHRVRVTLDTSGWVRAVEIVGNRPAKAATSPGGSHKDGGQNEYAATSQHNQTQQVSMPVARNVHVDREHRLKAVELALLAVNKQITTVEELQAVLVLASGIYEWAEGSKV